MFFKTEKMRVFSFAFKTFFRQFCGIATSVDYSNLYIIIIIIIIIVIIIIIIIIKLTKLQKFLQK